MSAPPIQLAGLTREQKRAALRAALATQEDQMFGGVTSFEPRKRTPRGPTKTPRELEHSAAAAQQRASTRLQELSDERGQSVPVARASQLPPPPEAESSWALVRDWHGQRSVARGGPRRASAAYKRWVEVCDALAASSEQLRRETERLEVARLELVRAEQQLAALQVPAQPKYSERIARAKRANRARGLGDTPRALSERGILVAAASGQPAAGGGGASQVDRWLDSVGMSACKKDVRAAGILQLFDLANIDAVQARTLLPAMPAKLRNQLFAKLEEVDPDEFV